MRPILCDPRHITVAVAPRPLPLRQIVAAYPNCQAAFRGGFSLYHGGPGIGLLVIGPSTRQDPTANDLPVLYRRQGRLGICSEAARASDADWMIAAGPLLVQDAHLAWGKIEYRPLLGVGPRAKRARTAVGIRPDGKAVIGAFPKATLYDVAKTMLGFGCAWAMAFDGGSGTDCYAHKTWYRYEGSHPAYIPNALLVVGPCQAASVLPVLGRGSRGQYVRTVQKALAAYNPGPVDGIFGPRTEAAVVAWQKAEQLPVTGKVGPYDWHRLGVM